MPVWLLLQIDRLTNKVDALADALAASGTVKAPKKKAAARKKSPARSTATRKATTRKKAPARKSS